MIKDMQRLLRNMPYTDMLMLAHELLESLKKSGMTDKRLDSNAMAQALAALAMAQIGDRSDISAVEYDSLRKVFTRDRAIKVRRLTAEGPQKQSPARGWHVELTGNYPASVVNADLKVALDMLLDTVAAQAALKG